MGEKENIVHGIERFKKNLAKKKKIEKVIFFGSRASGKPKKDSDIDLIIVSPYFRNMKCGRGRGLHRYWTLDYPVDFLCYTPEEFEREMKQVSIVSEALKNGIAI